MLFTTQYFMSILPQVIRTSANGGLRRAKIINKSKVIKSKVYKVESPKSEGSEIWLQFVSRIKSSLNVRSSIFRVVGSCLIARALAVRGVAVVLVTVVVAV